MRARSSVLAVLGGLVVASVWAAPAPTGKADPGRIAGLVDRLGSAGYHEREAAARDLEAIGEPALDALAKALTSPDPEVRDRAARVARRIASKADAERVLAPTTVRLKCDNQPVPAAVAQFAKASGAAVQLVGDTSRLAERRINLDTGEVPFWDALEKLCSAAGLVEVTPPPQTLEPTPMPVQPGFGGRGGLGRPIRMPIRIQPIPNPPPQPPPAPPGRPNDGPAPPQPPPPPPPQPPLPPAQIQLQQMQQQVWIQLQQQVQAQLLRRRVLLSGPGAAAATLPSGPILLADGSAKTQPTAQLGSLRVRTAATTLSQPVPGDVHGVPLDIRFEPQLKVERFLGARATRAIDSEGQVLDPVELGAPPAGTQQVFAGQGQVIIWQSDIDGPALPTAAPIVGVRRGDKPAKALKELHGTVAAQVRTPVEEVVAVTDLLAAKDTIARGRGGVSLKVVSATRSSDGLVKIQLELRHPKEVLPEGTDPEVEELVKMIRVRSGQDVTNLTSHLGLVVTDAKGEAYWYYGIDGAELRKDLGSSVQYTATLRFRPVKPEQGAPAKIALRASRLVDVEVPFVLRDVPLP